MPVKTTNEIEALYDACIFGETENIDRILGEDDLKEYGAKNLQKAVMFAANQKDKKIAVQLLSNKIIVDEINTLKHSMTPLMIAIDYGLGSNVIDELILSSNLDAVDDYGLSALMYAIMKGDLNLVKKLDMTDKSISDNDSNSLLLTAVKSGNIDIVDYLLDTRSIPELTLTNYEGKTALHVAAEENHIDVLKLLIKDPIFKSQLNTKDIYGRTPLDIALEQKSDDCIQLLERQTNKNETFAKNSTYGKPLTQLGQSVLNNKVAQYLTLHGQDSSQILQYGGNCSGWAFLFHIYIAAGREDDFYEMLGCIESWDGSMESLNNTQLPLSLKGKYKDLEDFFLHITNDLVLFQFTTDITKELQLGWTQESRVEQYALVRDFSVGHELKAVFNHTFDSMSQEQLTEMLAFYSRWPGAHFDIGGGKHATSLYIMPDGKFKYYDPNLKNKMKIIDSAEELSDYIVKTKYKHIDMINDGKFSISFDAYKFYKSLDKIPELEKPLTTEQHKKYSPNGLTPLHYAVMENDLEKAHKLMQDHPNLINELDAFGNSAFEYIGLMSNINFNMLDLFAQSGKVDLNSILCKLIKAKKNLPFIKAIANQPALDINQPHEQSKSILLFALNEYDLDVFSRTEIIQILLQHPNIDINKKNNRGKSPLMLALKYKVNPDVIKLFLSRPELQTNIADDKNKTALYYAIKSGYDIDIIQSILQLSLKEKSYKELYDSTTLKEAIKNRNLELYSMLLEAGATLDGQILFDALESFSYTPEVIEMLSKYNIDINAKNEDGETPLMVALEDEVSPETIKLLLSNPTLRADVTDDNDETALQHAIDNGYSLEIIQTILQLSLQEKPYAELYSPSLLGNAIDNNNIELINLFLEYGAILNEEAIYNTEDEKTRDHIQGWRLYHAIIKNDLQEVQKILRACPQTLNIPTYQGFTPCEIAIEKENIDPLILSTLLSSPHLDLQRKNMKGKTLLHYAIQNEVSIDVFSLLLKNPNIDLNIIDNFERPPLIALLQTSPSREKVQLFLEQKPLNIYQADPHGYTALMCAIENEVGIEIIEDLIAREGEKNPKNEYGRSALMVAVNANSSSETIQALLSKKGMVNEIDNDGRNALMLGLKSQQNKTNVHTILAHPSLNINQIDNNETSTLMHAILNNADPDIIQMMLQIKDININYQNKHDETALSLAIQQKNMPVVKMLLKHGATLTPSLLKEIPMDYKMHNLLSKWLSKHEKIGEKRVRLSFSPEIDHPTVTSKMSMPIAKIKSSGKKPKTQKF